VTEWSTIRNALRLARRTSQEHPITQRLMALGQLSFANLADFLAIPTQGLIHMYTICFLVSIRINVHTLKEHQL